MKRVLLFAALLGCGGSAADENGGDAAQDTSVVDALVRDVRVPDVASSVDGGVPDVLSSVDGGTDGDDASGPCVPGDVSGYTPSWVPPNAPQSRCTNADLDQLFASCFGSTYSLSACSAFRLARPLCYACVVTSDTAPRWGAVIASTKSMLDYGNLGGCLALETGDEGAASCGAAYTAMHGCTELACTGSQCPVQTQDEINAFNSCANLARAGDCAPYASALSACENALLADGGAGAIAVELCSFSTYGDLNTYWRALGGIFCGPQVDGGEDGGPTDAADGGPADAADGGLAEGASDGD